MHCHEYSRFTINFDIDRLKLMDVMKKSYKLMLIIFFQ